MNIESHFSFRDAQIEAALEFHAHEMNVDGNSRWECWNDRVEFLLNLPLPRGLDGDEAEDGYSLDFAYDAYCAGTTAKAYADSVRAKPQWKER